MSARPQFLCSLKVTQSALSGKEIFFSTRSRSPWLFCTYVWTAKLAGHFPLPSLTGPPTPALCSHRIPRSLLTAKGGSLRWLMHQKVPKVRNFSNPSVKWMQKNILKLPATTQVASVSRTRIVKYFVVPSFMTFWEKTESRTTTHETK